MPVPIDYRCKRCWSRSLATLLLFVMYAFMGLIVGSLLGYAVFATESVNTEMCGSL